MHNKNTKTTIDQDLLAKINRLRSNYKYFDEYLEGKDLSDYKVFISAFIHENQKYSDLKDIDSILDSDNINKDATGLLILIRDIINSKKGDITKIYIGALLNLTGASNWSELNTYYSNFSDYTNSLDLNAFIESPNQSLEQITHDHKLDNTKKASFMKFILLRVIAYRCQKRESPLVIESYIQGGMFKNGTVIVPERTFKRYYKSIDESKVLNRLLVILENYKDNFDDFFKLISAYHIDNFKSEHIKSLGESDNLAIKIPKFKGVDYKAIKSKADKILDSKNSNKSTNSISSEKVILFLYLIHEFNYVSDFSFNGNVSISSNKFSKFLGDTKVVNAIRDAYEDAGILANKSYAIIEVQSTSYNLSIDLKVLDYIALSDPYLIKILNDHHSLEHNYFLEDRLSLLNKVIDIIETKRPAKMEYLGYQTVNRIKFRPNRKSHKVKIRKVTNTKVRNKSMYGTIENRVNLTMIFLKSSNTNPIRSLLNIVTALKSKISNYSGKNSIINKDLINAFESLDRYVAIKLFKSTRSRLLWFLNRFENNSYFNFPVPTLETITDEEAVIELKKKYTKEHIKDNPDKFESYIEEHKIEMMKVNNKIFIDKLEDYCKLKNNVQKVPIGNKVEDLVEDDNLPDI